MSITLDMGIELLDGSMFSYTDPDVSNIDVETLAHVLSHIGRFAGHTRYFYSVAQHSVNVSLIVAEGFEKEALLHDTAEGFINDLPTPLKVALPGIKEIEQRIESRICEKFDVPYPMSPPVKLADLQMLGIEKTILKPSGSRWAILEGVEYMSLIPQTRMEPMTPSDAMRLFMRRWEEVQ